MQEPQVARYRNRHVAKCRNPVVARSRGDNEEYAEYQLAKDEYDYLHVDAFRGGNPYPMMQRVLVYSAVTMAYMVLEIRLAAFARFIRESRRIELKPNQIAGDPLSRTKLYLKRVADLELPAEHLWQSLGLGNL